jgi:hypothetical protein
MIGIERKLDSDEKPTAYIDAGDPSIATFDNPGSRMRTEGEYASAGKRAA